MPRPKPFTAADWEKRRHARERVEACASWRADKPTKAEIGQDAALAAKLVALLDLPRGRFSRADVEIFRAETERALREMMDVLREVRWEWRTRQDIVAWQGVALPVIGGVQPTRGEMRASLDLLRAAADKLRDDYRTLDPLLLAHAMIPFAEREVAVGVVIEHLAEALTALTDEYQPYPGRQPGRRAAAQRAARYLIRFIGRHAPDATNTQRRAFVFQAMRGLGIDCPDLTNDPGDYTSWLAEAETIARES